MNSIAEKMKTRPSSATDMIQKIAEKNVVSYQKYKGSFLTKNEKITLPQPKEISRHQKLKE